MLRFPPLPKLYTKEKIRQIGHGNIMPEAQKPLSTYQPPPFQPPPHQLPPRRPPPQTKSVLIGKALETRQEVALEIVERRSGLYILGKPGMGKSALMVNMAIKIYTHGHKIFFLDPHGDAISEFVKRFYANGKFLRIYSTRKIKNMLLELIF